MQTTAAEDAARQLDAMGIPAAAVSLIIITHFHADHVNSLRDFPRARFVVLRDGWEHFRRVSGGWLAPMHAFLPGTRLWMHWGNF